MTIFPFNKNPQSENAVKLNYDLNANNITPLLKMPQMYFHVAFQTTKKCHFSQTKMTYDKSGTPNQL